jgi:hypothetical protein
MVYHTLKHNQMKKTIILLSLSLCFAIAAIAQDTVAPLPEQAREPETATATTAPALQAPKPASHKYFPQAGDFAIGIVADPFLTYIGGLFSDAGATAPTFGLEGQGIYGKYFLSNNRAIRARLMLDIYSTTNKQSVRDDEAYSITPDATAIDTKKESITDAILLVGYEFRRGRGRVQGFWGGELGFGIERTNTSYTYGNPMTLANQAPTSGFGVNPAARPLESKGGLTLAFGLGGFAGVEFFISRQVALGGEFTLFFNALSRSQDEVTTQSVKFSEVREDTKRQRSAGDEASALGLQTITSGSIYLIFYF